MASKYETDGLVIDHMLIPVEENLVKNGWVIIDHEHPDTWYKAGKRAWFGKRKELIPVRVELFGHAWRPGPIGLDRYEEQSKESFVVGVAPPDAKPIQLFKKK